MGNGVERRIVEGGKLSTTVIGRERTGIGGSGIGRNF